MNLDSLAIDENDEDLEEGEEEELPEDREARKIDEAFERWRDREVK